MIPCIKESLSFFEGSSKTALHLHIQKSGLNHSIFFRFLSEDYHNLMEFKSFLPLFLLLLLDFCVFSINHTLFADIPALEFPLQILIHSSLHQITLSFLYVY